MVERLPYGYRSLSPTRHANRSARARRSFSREQQANMPLRRPGQGARGRSDPCANCRLRLFAASRDHAPPAFNAASSGTGGACAAPATELLSFQNPTPSGNEAPVRSGNTGTLVRRLFHRAVAVCASWGALSPHDAAPIGRAGSSTRQTASVLRYHSTQPTACQTDPAFKRCCRKTFFTTGRADGPTMPITALRVAACPPTLADPSPIQVLRTLNIAVGRPVVSGWEQGTAAVFFGDPVITRLRETGVNACRLRPAMRSRND